MIALPRALCFLIPLRESRLYTELIALARPIHCTYPPEGLTR
jgi:hypothetical protein